MSRRHRLFATAIALAALSVAAVAQPKCTRMYPVNNHQFGLFNNCGQCQYADVAWCDGSIKNFPIQPHQGVVESVCLGTATLVGDHPCDGKTQPPGVDNLKEIVGLESKTSAAGSVTAHYMRGAKEAGSSCSATNDSGDTCSVECPAGQAAQCSNSNGASPPQCSCSGR